MGKSCIYEAKNGKDLDNKIKASPYTVALFKYAGCGHCANVDAQLEKACRSFGSDSPISFVKCDIKKDKECYARWEASRPKNVPKEKYGVPSLLGLSPNNPYSNPMWQVIGEHTEEIDNIINQIGQQLTAWRQGKNKNAPAQAQQQHMQQEEPQQRREYSSYQKMAPMYGKIAYESAEPPMKKFYQMRSNPNYIGVDDELCLPPRCDRETSRKSIIKFIL